MIVPIEINTDDILDQFDLSSVQIEHMLSNIVKSLAVVYLSKLEEQASNELHSTRRRYIQSIRLVESGKLESTVFLDYSKDALIKAIEEGAPGFDLKQGMLGSPKAKTSKSGKKYISIPFRWGTPGAIGESDLFSGRMPSDIYQIVREKESIVPISGGGSKTKPLSIGEIPKQYQSSARPQVVDSTGAKLFDEYKHKSSIYEGISKITDSVTAQSTYFSFRRVSENSDTNSFIHPGFQQKGLIEKALSNMNLSEEIGIQIDKELSKFGF